MAAMLKTHGRGWIQESYETGDPDIKRRAKELRARGYRVHSESMGSQVTQYGRLKMTLLDIRPGTSGDAYLEQANPRRSVRHTKKRMKKLLLKYHPKLSKAQQRREMGEVRRIIRAGGFGRSNPLKVRKVKGGRAVSLRNFTGTVVQKKDGSVTFRKRGRR